MATLSILCILWSIGITGGRGHTSQFLRAIGEPDIITFVIAVLLASVVFILLTRIKGISIKYYLVVAFSAVAICLPFLVFQYIPSISFSNEGFTDLGYKIFSYGIILLIFMPIFVFTSVVL